MIPDYMTLPFPKTRLTPQRKMILSVIQSACYHPTAEQIFSLVKKRLPAISMGTVYRNLDILTQQGEIHRIDIPGEPVRFDADRKNKAYFVCKNKGVIYDLKIDAKKLKSLIQCNCIDSIDDFHILLFGISKNIGTEKEMRKGTLNNKF